MPKKRRKRRPLRRDWPSFSLEAVQKAIASGPQFGSFLSDTALNQAAELNLDQEDICEAILELKPSDFRKSVASYRPGEWLDIYKHRYGGMNLYIKFTMNLPGSPFVISFHEWEGKP